MTTYVWTVVKKYIDDHNDTVDTTIVELNKSPIYPVAHIIMNYAFLTMRVNINQLCSNMTRMHTTILSDPERDFVINMESRHLQQNNCMPYTPNIVLAVRNGYYSCTWFCECKSLIAAIIDGDYTGFNKDIDVVLPPSDRSQNVEIVKQYKIEILKNMQNVTAELLIGC